MSFLVSALDVRNAEEYSNYCRCEKLEVVGVKTEADNELHNDIGDDTADCNSQKFECKILENLRRQRQMCIRDSVATMSA